MKIAVISDIHGNSYALNAVLEDAKLNKVERLFILGDIVGYYYSPQIVLDLLSEWLYDIIIGNHENILEALLTGRVPHEDIISKYGSGHQKALNYLSKQQLQFLTRLPDTLSIEIDHIRFLLCHGSPWSTDFYLYPDVSLDILERCNNYDYDFIFVGHSHYQFAAKLDSKTLINVGSVGQSRQKGGIANWALINTQNKVFELKATKYDTTELEKEILTNDPKNSYLLNILKR